MDPKEEEGQVAGDEGTPENADPIRNLKAEFNRKLSAQDESLKALRESTERLAQIAQGLLQPKQSTQQVQDDGDLDPYDPQFVKKVEERAKRAASSVVNEQAERQRVMGDIVNRFPEIGDVTSDLHKRAAAIYDSLPQTAANMELAALKAAAELGVSPMSVRKKQTSQSNIHDDDADSFTMPASSTKGSSRPDEKGSKKKVSDKTIALASLMGLDVTDKKQLERLEKRAQRKVWNKYGQ